ncbi:MAG: hypothetical protein H0U54_16735 [Acidobacteria bacterium]|nr:hypothetical protein [Acidobacteriota bacterium]
MSCSLTARLLAKVESMLMFYRSAFLSGSQPNISLKLTRNSVVFMREGCRSLRFVRAI